MAKVLMPLANGFEEIEALAVVDVLRRAKIEVVLAGLQPGAVESARKVVIVPDTTLDAVTADSFAMIILPGGQPGTDNLNADRRVHALLKEFASKDKMIGAICAAPIVLASAGLLSGRRVTCYPDYCDRLDGVIFEDKPVVCDGKIITSQGPGTAIAFGIEIAMRLAGRHTAEAVAAAMLISDTPAVPAPPQTEAAPGCWDQHLFNSIIQALVGALEQKDSYAQGQARRVAEYSLSIGAKLKMPNEELRDLYLGAMLHDVGKYNTAEDVLNKPDSLNLREETLTREHTLKGTLFVVGIENLSHIGPTILHHHERWDGTGYPGVSRENRSRCTPASSVWPTLLTPCFPTALIGRDLTGKRQLSR
ncbi:MAG: DJ-1/PfpI family protein [Deltaproteobacteria bacterium]|nr:DJ-1/PfpI family protein [Deltaproteobacteria bacterium]